MESPFTNIHIHVFNAECAPKNFLRIIDAWIVRKFPGQIKWILERKSIRWTIWKLNTLLKRKKRRGGLEKYLSFLNVGTKHSQSEIFTMAWEIARKFDSEARIVALTMDMDYMDNQGAKPSKTLASQLEEVKQIKRYHPDYFFPFLGVDPRSHSGENLVKWVKSYLEKGVQSKTTGKYYPFFCGIKIYPALGFFPFDPRLDELYAYAEENGIPIMSHCTRVGSQYVGNDIESLIPRKPKMITPENWLEEASNAQREIYDRIERYYQQGWVKNSKIGNNNKACDLFGHPENYIPIMLKYPKLKICLAHMGGSDEMVENGDKTQKEIWEIDKHNWAKLVKSLMVSYDHLYTDISYSLSELGDVHIRNQFMDWFNTKDKDGKSLYKKILFGTDYYMTEREKEETKLYALAKDHLEEWFESITKENTEKYLRPIKE